MAHAQELHNSHYLDRARRTAAALSLHVDFGFAMKDCDRVWNAGLLTDERGDGIGVYCNNHLRGHDRHFSGGSAPPVFGTKLGKTGIMICADRRWPEVPRTPNPNGVELIVSPTYGTCHDSSECMMGTRAYENEVYIAFAHPRVSFVCGPSGDLEAKLLSSVPGVLVCDLYLARRVEKMVPYRQPDLCSALTFPSEAR